MKREPRERSAPAKRRARERAGGLRGEAPRQKNDYAAAIAHATAALVASVNRSDLAGVMAVWGDDGVLMPPHHPSVDGRAAIERYFTQLFHERQLEFTFTSSTLEVSGDLAVERVQYDASMRPRDGGPAVRGSGKGVHVYRRQADGSWKLAADIWNSDAP